MKKIILLLTIFLAFFSSNSYAQLFNTEVTRISTGQTVSATFHSIKDAINYFDTDNLNSQFGANVSAEPLNANLNFRGLPATLTYSGTNTIVLQIDDIVTKTFTGTSRDDAINQIEDYFKNGDPAAISQVLRRLAKVSPVDPIAGNPTSLMSQMIDHDFDLTYVDSMYDSPDAGSERNEMGLGVKYSQYDISGLDAKVLTVAPFSWRRNLGDSDAKFLVRFPTLSAIDTEGGRTYQASAAFGFHIPIIGKVWSVAPLASIGAVGSADLGAASAIHSFSITNKLRFEVEGWGLHVGTLFGNYSTDKVTINDYTSDPQIENNVLKNSLGIRAPLNTMQDYALELSVGNTRFYGTDLYIENAMDYGISFIKTSNVINNEFRVDLKYFSYDAERVATIGNGSTKVQGVQVALKFQY